MEENQVSIKMIKYTKALKLISQNVIRSKKLESIKTDNSNNRILGRDYLSKVNLPKNNLSAMDGAVILKKEKKSILKIIGESKAGDKKAKNFKNGECFLVYTGAPIFGDDKHVIPRENFAIKKNNLIINSISKELFIRKKSSDLTKHKKYLFNGEIMNIRSIALAKSMGLNYLKVVKKPKVFVICTGDELINEKNKTGIVVSTNNIFIKYFVELFGGEIVSIQFSKDNQVEFSKKFKSLKNFDLLITSGGISKGKYDIVKGSLKEFGLKILFQRVAIKPGKPTTFGKLNKDKFFLGLPGNPVSCFMSLINFLPMYINSYYGKKIVNLKSIKLLSKSFIEKNNKLTLFQRVIIRDKKFEIIKDQDSSLINMLKVSNGILMRPPYSKSIKPNEKIKILLFDEIDNQKLLTT